MEPEACLIAQAKLIEPSASSWGHIEGSQNVSMMLSKAGSYAQAWHDVHTASTSAFNMWLQTYILKSMKTRNEPKLGTMSTQPVLVHTTHDYKNEFII
jgi:hypothetical protein